MKKKFIVTFIVSLIFFAGVFWTANKVLDVMEMTSRVEFLGHELGEGNVIEQTVENELLFLVLGLDSDDFSGATTERNRTDTMILVKVNFETGKIDMLSIPRDSRVMVNGKLDKINHAHHFGGLKMAMQTVRNFLGIDVDYYVRVNFFSVKDIVDALGGVEVDVPVRVDVAEDNVHLNPGKQVLNGKQALQFARFRAGYAEGDLGRVRSQQLLVKSMLNELTKPKNIAKVPELLEVIKKTVSTNIPFSTIAKMSLKAGNLSTDKFNAKIVPGEGKYIHNTSYYVVNKSKLKPLITEMFSDYTLKSGANIPDNTGVDNETNRNTTKKKNKVNNVNENKRNTNREDKDETVENKKTKKKNTESTNTEKNVNKKNTKKDNNSNEEEVIIKKKPKKKVVEKEEEVEIEIGD